MIQRFLWTCVKCKKTLGEFVEGGHLIVTHGGMRMVASLPVWRQCERCGTWNWANEHVRGVNDLPIFYAVMERMG